MRTLNLCKFGLRDNSRKEATNELCMSNNPVLFIKKKKKEHYLFLKIMKKKEHLCHQCKLN